MRKYQILLIPGALLALAGLACSPISVANPAPTMVFESQPTPIPVVATIDPLVIQQEVQVALTQIAAGQSVDGAIQPVNVNLGASGGQDIYKALYEQVSNSVVSIYVETRSGAGQGSGYVYDAEGHIVTNLHVVEDAVYVEVTFPSEHRTTAEVVGTDSSADLAVLSLDQKPENLHPLPLGDSSSLRIGEEVVAIGNPFGLAGTMTTGIVSGLGRTLTGLQTSTGVNFSAPDVIQTDAAINPGNSGGPLINLRGEVVGLNRAIISETGTSSGVGFSVSSNTIARIIPELLSEGRYRYPYLGITSTDELTLAQLNRLELPQSGGIYITSVVPNGPAAKAGLQAAPGGGNSQQLMSGGDFIEAVNGQDIHSFEDLISYLFYNTKPGDDIVLKVWRNGAVIDIHVTLGERPN